MILVFGDSHSNMFAGVAGVVHQRSPQAVTARRVSDPTFSELWSWLAPWFEVHRGADSLVLSASEIDIRAHFWRHLPREFAQGTTVPEFMAGKVAEFMAGIARIQQVYGIARVVLWSAPPATANTTYSPDWPFVGSVSTRNVLIHLFNSEFQRQIQGNSQVFLATGFYDYIDPQTYLPRDHIPSDGVHWHDSLRDQLWTQHIAPAISGHAVDLGSAYHAMSQHRPYFVEHTTSPGCLYDTWVRTEDLPESRAEDPRAVVGGVDFSRIYLKDSARFPASYRELALINQ